MSKSTLFDVNPDELFAKSSIPEIDQVQKKLQHEIERKREELRTMVGERYRDLIQAADTIAEMKVTSASVVKHVGRISNACEKSQENGFLKLQITNTKKNKTYSHLTKNDVVIQIHLLINIPEQIWTCIENADYLKATQLYLLARHISTGLQIRVSESTELDKISNWRQLSQRQWNIIMSFKDNIKDACYKALKSSEVNSESAAHCLCSLSLLDDLPLPDILNKFISLRLESLNEILHPDEEHYNVKVKVVDSANLLINTLQLIYECFIGTTSSFIYTEMEKAISSETLSNIQISTGSYISEKVLADDVLQQAMTKWLKKVESYINEELLELINLVSSVKSLQGIRLKLSSIEKPSSWNELCQKVYVPEMSDIFGKYYQPLLTKRIEWLVQNTWNDALATVKKDLKIIIKNNNNQRSNTSWKDHTPQTQTTDSNSKENLFTLANVYGFNNEIIALCKKFDTCLKLLLEDLYIYLYEDNSNGTRLNKNENSCVDTKDILQYLRRHSEQSVKELMNFIKTDCLNSQSSITLTRFLTALLSLCPNLSKCFQNDQANDCDNAVYGEIKSLNLQCWERWLEDMNNLILESIKKLMPKEFSSRTLLTVLSQWDTIRIQEKDDQGNSIESCIKIPSHTSLPLQNVLNVINSRITQIQPHTLPNVIRQQLILNIANNILDYYENLSQNEDVRAKQVPALQFYLDVKYLQLLTLQRDNKLSIEKFQRVADFLKSIIDPFDFDVFYPHLQNNIKKAVQKTQMQMGCIVSKPEQLTTILGNPNATPDVPCIIPLVNSQNDQGGATYWFTLLPVTAPINNTVTRHQNQNPVEKLVPDVKPIMASPKHKTESSKATKETPASSTGLVRSGAAAFFGAMSQDWFGSH